VRGGLRGLALACFVCAVVALAWLVPAASPAAADDGSSSSRYLLTGHFQLRIDEQVQEDARIYKAESGAPEILIAGGDLPGPLLLTARERTIRDVAPDKLSFPGDGQQIAVVEEGALGRQGPAKVTGQKLYFHLPGGKRGIIEPREAILGEITAERILEDLPEFARNVDGYEANVGQIRLLSSASDARVRVFFGTWCSHCEQVVPRLVKLQQQLEGEGPTITYHGVPRRISEDPLARRLDVHAVPTAVVFRGDALDPASVVGKLSGAELDRPEQALSAALFGGG
jgi:thiol-disulfide isomerase/thioredoxin